MLHLDSCLRGCFDDDEDGVNDVVNDDFTGDEVREVGTQNIMGRYAQQRR